MRSLSTRALILLMVAFLPPAVLLLYVLFETAEREEALAYDSAERWSQLILTMQQNLVEDAEATLQLLSLIPDVRNAGRECRGTLTDVVRHRPMFLNIGVVELDGRVSCSVMQRPGVSLADRDYFQGAVRTGRLAVSGYQVGRLTGQPSIAIAYPMRSGDERVERVIFAAIDLAWLKDIGRRAQLPAGSAFVLLDKERRILARFPNDSGYVGRPFDVRPILTALSRDTQASVRAPGLDGVERLYSVASLRDPAHQAAMHAVVGIPAASALATAVELRRRTLPLLMGLLAVSMVLTWWAAQRLILRRLSILSRTASQVAAGDWTARAGMQLHGRDEIGALARTFDAMAEALVRHSETLEQRVHERTTQLQIANRELEAFSYSVSHDLRSPLRSIDGFSQAVLEDYGDRLDERGQDYLRRVRNATQRMSRLIDDLLHLSRITRKPIERHSVDLSSMARGILAELQMREPARKVDVEVAPGIEAAADPGLARALLANLLSNAWKFTGRCAHARIEVGLSRDGPNQTVYVRDNGVGFDMEYADKLFGAFQRLHTTEEYEGTGIGLATVQRIVNRHGGQIWAESAPGQGATFYFSLGKTDDLHSAGRGQ